ncbi:N2,N2-dimethylguanosine tRNA methyltransferase [Abortiporus biennis]|nr:N2,N2-dimethylguanosine tRNA methyltransferase [Abortiporus biennis]
MDTKPESIVVPEGYKLHSENTSHILLPDNNGAFLNPVQEFNRDLSVACIRTWGDVTNAEKKRKREISGERRAKKEQQAQNGSNSKRQKTPDSNKTDIDITEEAQPAQATSSTKREYHSQKFVILEALSATGLRSIRYAKEIPLVKFVIANDLSPTAAEAMRRNVDLNGLGEQISEDQYEEAESSNKKRVAKVAKVKVNEGDACTLMYNYRTERDRVDVVDLDPYGTAAPFIDCAVQCVKDGGLLCITCTDLAVLASTNYAEKCFSNYGGVPIKAEYCHEGALRLLLHTISTSAARYGRHIQPLLSLSIDFYIRVFVRVSTSPIEVKKLMSKTSTFYVCSGCQSFYEQPLGRVHEQVSAKGNTTQLYKVRSGPTVSEQCPECNSILHVAGPMWSGELHDQEFVSKGLEHLEANEDKYGTAARMKGMLTLAKEELTTPFYFTPAKMAGNFHCICPPLDDVASALLHAGHNVSRSHACAGSLKTDAGRDVVHDIFRSWIKTHPVRMDRVSETSPAKALLAKEPKFEANFKHHPKSVTAGSKVKLVRYQMNPTPNWGPGSKASSGVKRKREQGEPE